MQSSSPPPAPRSGGPTRASLVDVDAFELAQVGGRRRHRARGRRRPPTSTTSSSPSRSRAAASSPATSPSSSASPTVPGLADNRHCAAGLAAVQIAAGLDPRRHGPTSSSPVAPRASRTSPPSFKRARARPATPQPWMSPSHPRDPRRPRLRHVDHRGREHRRRDGPHPRATSTSGRAYTHGQAIASIDSGCVRRARSCPVEVTDARRQAP